MNNKLYRIIDANLNRLKESMRVSEDLARFVLDDKSLTSRYKSLRHRVKEISSRGFLRPANIFKYRDVRRDVGRRSTGSENSRRDFLGLYLANTARSKESLRVLEETVKLLDARTAEKFKEIRFKVYELEKKGEKKFETLRHTG